MRLITSLIVVSLMLLCDCAHHDQMRFQTGSGDAVQFIIKHAIIRGGQPITTNGLPTITNAWEYAEDEDGVIIRLSRDDYEVIETLLRQVFGEPSYGPYERSDAGSVGAYQLSSQGGAISFGYDAEGTQVIILSQEYMDSINDEMRLDDFRWEHEESAYEKPKILETIPPSISFKPGDKEQSGKVVVKFILKKDGVVIRFKTIEAPNEIVAQSVNEAIKKWKFEPAKFYNGYVPSRVYIQIDLPYSPDKISLWVEGEENKRQQFNNSMK